ncbi:hypothetical protein CEUSTIGMA_g11655.t1 [Chlamydomonas eustigma]|uniref:Nudix hydrolase domain-containing protein n=1 Tax=Chlamydomonas eustigma TaxID=1157962 RepID=A0A250XMV0_9CHLO|nr:hypothetical protein CEUSTIGMA_g11655.t1 [Chlamydomonas eustigma]|eukprot:GAX84232.1 hypothetical protein CEUSTIGMA_g11655.t1 [Chlamydomonas eustigma]
MLRSLIVLRPLNNNLVDFIPRRVLHISRAMSHTYRYPRPSITVDTIIISEPQPSIPPQLLLIKRKNDPFKDCWALPGGFVDENEGLDAAAARELQEETSVDPSTVDLIQVGSFGDPGRDPRGWTVTVAYAAIVPDTNLGVKAADDAADAQWYDLKNLPLPLAFDHQMILCEAFKTMAQRFKEAEDKGGLKLMLKDASAKLS